MQFTFRDNKYIIFDNGNPVSIGNTFLDFINCNLSEYKEKLNRVIINMKEDEQWDKPKKDEYFSKLLNEINSLNPYLYYLKSRLEDCFERFDEDLILVEIEKKKIIRNASFDLESWIQKMKTINCDYILNTISKEWNHLIIYQTVFKSAAMNCLDVDSQIHGNDVLTKLYNYGTSKLGPRYYNEIAENINEIYATESIFQLAEQRYHIEIINSKPVIIETFTSEYDAYLVCYQEFYKMVINNVSIKKCRNCGLYFIPENRIDTLYCNNQYMNTNKTCKDIGAMKTYKNKIDMDPIYSTYNKTYQSKYAKLVKPYRSNNFKKSEALKSLRLWQYKAKEKLSELGSCNGKEQKEALETKFLEWLKYGDEHNG